MTEQTIDTAIIQQEVNLYGSARLGVWRPERSWKAMNHHLRHYKNQREYELCNHLGNVLSVVYDHKLGYDLNSQRDYIIDYYEPCIKASQDYYPGGMLMPGRSYSSDKYRFGFNGKENDNEVKGTGNQQDYGMRIYDPRIVKFLSVDPLTAKYPFYTPYQFAGNNPIAFVDLDGCEPAVPGNNLYNVEPSAPAANDNGADHSYTWENDEWKDQGRLLTGVETTAKASTPENSNSFDKQYYWFRTGLDERKNPYIWKNSETNALVDAELSAALLFAGGGGLVNGFRTGLTQGVKFMATRFGVDALAQFGGNMAINNGDIGTSLGNINWTESGLAGVGINPFSLGVYSSSFSFTANRGFQSVFNGGVNSNQLLTGTAFGSAFGYAGNTFSSFLRTTNAKQLGLYIKQSIGVSQQIGTGLGYGILGGMKTTGFGIDVLGNSLQNKFGN